MPIILIRSLARYEAEICSPHRLKKFTQKVVDNTSGGAFWGTTGQILINMVKWEFYQVQAIKKDSLSSLLTKFSQSTFPSE